ncbi:thiamine-binding protein [Candidatus Chlorohelix sp.]|uniref:thiamine-binding protein n=1 Tax=Candidatus Chlorohelix sp. TaxID=3139201 RepID=UPI00303BC4B7
MVIADLQVLPNPLTNDPSAPYAFVDKAIAVIEQSGLKYQVGPLGTWVQGELEAVLALVPAMTKAMRLAGASKVITIIKIADSGEESENPLAYMDKWLGKD